MRLWPRRPPPTAHELIQTAITRQDYRAAAVFITAGALAVLEEARELTDESTASERTLRLAVAKVTAAR